MSENETSDASMNEDLKQFIAVLLDEQQTSEDALYAGLAANLPSHEAFGSDLVERGRSVFRNARRALQRGLCPKLHTPAIKVLISSEQSADAIALAAIVAGIIGSLGLGLNAALAAALLVRMGLRNICPDLPA